MVEIGVWVAESTPVFGILNGTGGDSAIGAFSLALGILNWLLSFLVGGCWLLREFEGFDSLQLRRLVNLAVGGWVFELLALFWFFRVAGFIP